MIITMKRWVPFFPILFVLIGADTCDTSSGGSQNTGEWEYGGSTWAYEIELSFHDPNAEGLEFSEFVHSMKGEFTLQAEPNSGSWYLEEDIIPETEVRYTFVEWVDGDDRCEGKRGESTITPAQEIMVQYSRLNENSLMLAPPSNGETATPEHYLLLSFLYNDEYFESLTDFSSDVNGSFQYTCTYTRTTPSGAVYTETVQEGAVPPPVFVSALYAGALENGTDSWFVEGEEGATMVGVITLQCLSGCNPPPEKEDECDEDAIQRECDDFKEKVLQVCQQLEDWMVVESNPEGTSFTCATADCSGATSTHQSSEPFTSVTYEADLACEESDYACTVECYGWGAP